MGTLLSPSWGSWSVPDGWHGSEPVLASIRSQAGQDRREVVPGRRPCRWQASEGWSVQQDAMSLQAFHEELIATATAIASPGKGLLAADESTGTIGKRFEAIGLENTEDHRRAYRSLLGSTSGLGQSISGVILYEETLFQDASDGTPILELFRAQGIIPGIKVDQGVQPRGQAGRPPRPLEPGLLLWLGPAALLPAAVGRSRRGRWPGGPAGQGSGQLRGQLGGLPRRFATIQRREPVRGGLPLLRLPGRQPNSRGITRRKPSADHRGSPGRPCR